ncbi:unnamed protein product [Lactuca virosa]|uniref:Uncharacterized protein n=1 Tax=Lactuca virosa TaxID=75947 RepID=A0AAU9PWY0_9ASTR|nr:unnamed protein product [Lactuca virosa]
MKLARKFDLPNQERRDSHGICFLGKVRHGRVFYDCSLHIEEKDGIGTVMIRVSQLAHLQLFINKELCMGSRVILESWDNAKGFLVSVSDKARHIARMEDNSKLGKEEKLDKLELAAKIKLLPDPWTHESGLVTAALKLKREQLKAKFKDDLQKLYE